MENLELQLIEAYTDENYHNEALMIKAISQERFDLLKELADIKIKHLEDGFMSQENINKRSEIEQKLK
jgi:nicotinamide riboside kinase